MSIDERAEQAAYNAIAAIAEIPRQKERARISKELLRIIAKMNGWDITLVEK